MVCKLHTLRTPQYSQLLLLTAQAEASFRDHCCTRAEIVRMPAPTYIISKIADPIFAVFIGISAAAMRINREEKAKGYTTQQTIDNGLRYVDEQTIFGINTLLIGHLRRIGLSKKTA